MIDIKWTCGAEWFSGPDNDQENLSQDFTGSLEEVIEHMRAFEAHLISEAEKAENVIPDDEGETFSDHLEIIKE